MDELGGATSRIQDSERSNELLEIINKVLQVLGGFFFVNGIYFAVFTTSVFTAIVYYAFLLMLLTGIGYYYLSSEDIENQLFAWHGAVVLLLDSFEVPGAKSTPEQRRRL